MEKYPGSTPFPDEGSGYYTKKITLPGGKIIEVVYFSDPNRDPLVGAGAADNVSPEQELLSYEGGLHICPECDSDLVYPRDWAERKDDMWHVDLRCPDCELTYDGEFDQDDIELFDDVLNEGTEEVLIQLKEISIEAMELDVERFIGALAADAIEPMDFASTATYWPDKFPPARNEPRPAW